MKASGRRRHAAADMTDRLILPMLDVCVACLREGIVADEDIVDGAMIFATGFAPFRGGPMHYARTRGVANVRDALERLPQNMARASSPIRAGTADMIASGAAAGSLRRRGTARRAIIEQVGKTIVLALPLGLGKANHVANALFARAAADPSIKLRIFTALTLEAPRAKSELERRFLEPIAERLFGGYPELAYAAALHAGAAAAQRRGRRVLLPGRPVARRRPTPSRTTSPRTTPMRSATCSTAASMWWRSWWRTAPTTAHALQPELQYRPHARPAGARRGGRADFLLVGQVNSELPFMPATPTIGDDEFDLVLDSPATDFPLFAPPREPVDLAEYAAGLHVARTGARRRHAADRHRLARRCGGAGADPAPSRQRRDFRATAVARSARPGARRRGHADDAVRRGPLRLQRNVRRRLPRPVSAPASSSARSTAPCCMPASSSARAPSTGAARDAAERARRNST